jgi:hypothetical protein
MGHLLLEQMVSESTLDHLPTIQSGSVWSTVDSHVVKGHVGHIGEETVCSNELT